MSRFTIPRDIFFGRDSMYELEALRGRYHRAYVVTGGVIPKLGLLDKLVGILQGAGMEVAAFVDVEPNPSVETVLKGAREMQEFKPDLLVAIGGGSAIDACKVMWAFYEYPDITFEQLRNEVPRLRRKAIMAAIPSTSGTGSEVTSFAVITDTHTHVKYPISDYDLTPDIAILDPIVTATMPAVLVAHTGMDALTHAMEAYVSKERNNFTRPLAMHAISTITGYIEDSYYGDLEARDQMHVAQCMAGMAFTNSQLGICHSLAHSIGTVYNLSHGCCNALLLPYVMMYNMKDHAAQRHYAVISRRLGLDGRNDKTWMNSLVTKVQELNAALGIPATLEAAGVSEFKFKMTLDECAQHALEDPCTLTNPRDPTVEELKHILECAYSGRRVIF